MSYCCCICGLVLAANDSDFPQWCKEIRALCQVGCKARLTDIGYMDYDDPPFNLSVPSYGFRRFYYRRDRKENGPPPDFCYPFHDACWALVKEISGDTLSGDDLSNLFDIFESFHYVKTGHYLRWGHNYYLEDILDFSSTGEEGIQAPQTDIVAANKSNRDVLADPWCFNLNKKVTRERHQTISKFEPTASLYRPEPCLASCSPMRSRLISLPCEVIELIMCNVDEFHGIQHLLQASSYLYRRYGADGCNIPHSFWQSRFIGLGETSFAKSICPSSYTWKDWFFTVRFELHYGANKANLQNRKRIWKLGVDLITLVHTITEPGRVLYGNVTTLLPNMRGSAASCLATTHDTEGCRELKQIYVPFTGQSSQSRTHKPRVDTISPTYVCVSNRKLISGLTFKFDDGKSRKAGYVADIQNGDDRSLLSPKFVWFVSSPLGYEAVSLGTYPRLPRLSSQRNIGVTRWPLESIGGICLGLDAMRIVRICVEALEQDTLDDVLWEPPFPSLAPSMHRVDIDALHKLQRETFAPASELRTQSTNGQMVVIKVHSPLGHCAGINAIEFVYNTGHATYWGCAADATSLAFFLDRAERLVKVTVYKIGSVVYHVQFTTNLHRASDVFPSLPVNSGLSLECVEYEASSDGQIAGFCGCILSSSRQLNCLGVISATPVIISESSWSSPFKHTQVLSPDSGLPEMPLGGVWNHGEHRSHLLLEKRYYSIQVSSNPVASNYRLAGQVTGLLFCPLAKTAHPDLLGQWTGAGKTYVFNETEQVLDLLVATCMPRRRVPQRHFLSQVSGITIVTNLRIIRIGKVKEAGQGLKDISLKRHKITEVTWDFNAMFDRVQCVYKSITET